ncbi:MAG: hypothetical protein M5U01_30205 [Ardenticatenaceae bacterium]|nr:hypothetical protein [Ardenticatenaceae bacterium]
MSASARDLLVRGIAAARAKDQDEARFYLQWVLRTDATYDQRADALRWLSEISDDPAEQREYLEQVLAHDPANPVARRRLAILDGRLDPNEIVDPNHLPSPATAAAGARTRRFTCRLCGGRMVFTPDGKSLVCQHCGQRQSLDRGLNGATTIEEDDFILALATAKGHLPPVATRSFRCQSCGAAFVLAPETISLTCPYCASVYVVELAEIREVIPPEAIIPFAVTQAEAYRALLKWLRARDGDTRVQVASPTGIYVPAWTFDVGGEMIWRGWKTSGDDLYRPVTSVSGRRPVFANDVLVPASRKLPAALVAELNHFALDQLVPYDPRYLAAWPAEIYEISMADASLEARHQTLARMKPLVADSVAAEEQVHDVALSSRLAIESFKLILVPMWTAHYADREQRFNVVINGQTGRVRGERRRSRARKLLDWLLGND